MYFTLPIKGLTVGSGMKKKKNKKNAKALGYFFTFGGIFAIVFTFQLIFSYRLLL